MDIERANWEPDLKSRLTAEIHAFIGSPANSLGMHDASEPAWGGPLIGFARGDDPIFQDFKRDIGVFYWTPADAFARGCPGIAAEPADLSVVSWVLSQTTLTRSDNRRESALPSERWVRAKYDGERVNRELHRLVISRLAEWGIAAVAPMLLPECRVETSERYGFSSTWSERHAAYAAGLGTFGLCDGLITPVGKAMRCGSVVLRAIIPATLRPYTDHHAYCLHYAASGCTSCMKRCPVGAITENGHDKVLCKAYLQEVLEAFIEPVMGLCPADRPFPIDACGLCQTAVPCESGIPRGLAASPAAPRAADGEQ